MFFTSKHMNCEIIKNKHTILSVSLDAENSVNVINKDWLSDFTLMLDKIESTDDIDGMIISSNKKDFCLGADINNLATLINEPEEFVKSKIASDCQAYNRLENLPFPTLSLINGFCLGGGLELTLCCDFRIVQPTAKLGLPETNLGIFPGYGGTVRTPRLIGIDNALRLITSAKPLNASAAIKMGLADSEVESEDQAITTLNNAIDQYIDWQKVRSVKLNAGNYNDSEAKISFQYAAQIAKKSQHRPEVDSIIKVIKKTISMPLAKAINYENEEFSKLAKTPSARALIYNFINNNTVNKISKDYLQSSTQDINSVCVVGAGIMGGGIAYQSAINNLSVLVKDINIEALNLAKNTFDGYLIKANKTKPLSQKHLNIAKNIDYTLNYDDIRQSQYFIEAVTENPKIKDIVLTELENNIADEAIITSNTSTISINALAKSLKKPERFCGMHFFNPVPMMQLVEIIRSEHTSEKTIAAAVQVAKKMGKTPIVVNDCPGFFINRVLFPYFAGFSLLVNEGVDFVSIDNIMSKKFGWPMGPAYLADVIGIDTLDHCTDVMAIGFPKRMAKIENDPITIMYKNERFGQKNSKGFYNFVKDKRGKTIKVANEGYDFLTPVKHSEPEVNYVIERLMIPMLLEVIRCLDEGIINTSSEADLGLIMALGFPAFRGGPLQLIQEWGWEAFIKKAKQYESISALYEIPECVYEMAKNDFEFYPHTEEQK